MRLKLSPEEIATAFMADSCEIKSSKLAFVRPYRSLSKTHVSRRAMDLHMQAYLAKLFMYNERFKFSLHRMGSTGVVMNLTLKSYIDK